MLAFIGVANACSGGADQRSGQNLSVINGCTACHAVDATQKIGPSWVGLYGSQVELVGGALVTADDVYLRESILEPNAKIVKGYTQGAMPAISLTEAEIDALIVYIAGVK